VRSSHFAAARKLALCATLLSFGRTVRAEEPAAEAAPAALSKAPRLVRFVEAAVPPELAARGEVEVLLDIDVDETGKVTAVAVSASGGPAFDEAALAAARQFVFEPGEAGGQAVPVRISYKYKFVMKPPPAPPAPAASAPVAPLVPSVPLDGRVLRKGDRVAVPGVSVTIRPGAGPPLEAVTDAAGAFSFDAVPLGPQTLLLRAPGIAAADVPVTLSAGKRLELTTYVDGKDRYASTVRGRRAVVETIEHTLTTEEIRRIPGTQGDALKAVQNLPGVARAPFGIGLLPVWGSAPRDTRVYVDGVPVPTLYHFAGLRSTVNGEMVQSLTFAPGGYQAEHGLGLGGVIDLETRHPRTDGYHGYAQMDLLDGSLMLEGPITKTLSFAVAGRRSWIDATLPLFSSSTFQLSPVYYDYQARLSWRPTPKDDVDVFFLGSDDRIKLLANIKDDALSATVGSHTYYHRGIASWLHRLDGGGTLSLTSSVGYDVPFQLGVQLGNVPSAIDVATLGYTARALARLPLSPWLRLDAGIDYEGNRWSLGRAGAQSTASSTSGTSGGFGGDGGFGGAGSYASDQLTLYTNHFAPFVSTTLSLANKRLTITPQVRAQVMTFAGYQGTPDAFASSHVSVEPRLAVRYQISPRVALKASAGMYAQPPAPNAFSRVFGNPQLSPERGVHYVAGVDVDVTRTLHLQVDGFYKDMRDLVVPATGAGPLLVNEGVGRAYGAEVLLRQELTRNFFGWVSYTLSRSERRDHPGEAWHRFQFDQTHILTLMASYVLPRGWQVGARYRFVTGSPYTPIGGAYFDSNTGRYVPINGAPYSGRLDPFSQLDLRVDKTFTFDKWRFSAYLDVQNVLRASNPEAVGYNFDFSKSHPISGLPLLPIIGIRADF
jgi:TonB family protein